MEELGAMVDKKNSLEQSLRELSDKRESYERDIREQERRLDHLNKLCENASLYASSTSLRIIDELCIGRSWRLRSSSTI